MPVLDFGYWSLPPSPPPRVSPLLGPPGPHHAFVQGPPSRAGPRATAGARAAVGTVRRVLPPRAGSLRAGPAAGAWVMGRAVSGGRTPQTGAWVPTAAFVYSLARLNAKLCGSAQPRACASCICRTRRGDARQCGATACGDTRQCGAASGRRTRSGGAARLPQTARQQALPRLPQSRRRLGCRRRLYLFAVPLRDAAADAAGRCQRRRGCAASARSAADG